LCTRLKVVDAQTAGLPLLLPLPTLATYALCSVKYIYWISKYFQSRYVFFHRFFFFFALVCAINKRILYIHFQFFLSGSTFCRAFVAQFLFLFYLNISQ